LISRNRGNTAPVAADKIRTLGHQVTSQRRHPTAGRMWDGRPMASLPGTGQRLDRFAKRHRVAWAVSTLAGAAATGVAGFFSIVLGSCHGGGGFCASELDLDAILEGYVAGVALVGLSAD
jgi:hypothetical protein